MKSASVSDLPPIDSPETFADWHMPWPRFEVDWKRAALVVIASHFPVLSEASRVAAAGLPYAGDLVNRAELERGLRSDPRPKVVLSGHIHARCSFHDGLLLQFTVGALIEPPFDATIVEVDATSLSVRRTARRLGEIAQTDPVFAGDDERWQRIDERWEAEATSRVAAA